MIIYDRTAELDTKKTEIIGLKVAHTNAWRIQFLTIHSRLAVNSEKTMIVYFTNFSLMCTVSGRNPSNSDQGFVLSSPAQ
jgi:hypothetical protein